MIFKTFEDEAGHTSVKVSGIFTSLKEDIQALFSAPSTKSNLRFSDSVESYKQMAASLREDKQAIESYIQSVQSGTSRSEAMSECLIQASSSAKEFANSISDVEIRTISAASAMSRYEAQQKASSITVMAQNKSLSNTKTLITEYNAILSDSIHQNEKNYVSLSRSGLSQQQYLDAVKKSNPQLATYLSGLRAADGTTKGYVGSLIGAKIATVGFKVATTALNAVVGFGTGLLVSFITSGMQKAIDAIIEASKTTKEKLSDLKSEFSDLSSELKTISNDFRSLKQNADNVIPRFVELANGVNEFGENVGLTDEQYAEFLELNNQIAEMFPELDMGFDSNGNAMLALSYSADTLRESLESLLEVQRKEAYQNYADKLPSTLENVRNTIDVYEEEIDKVKDVKEDWEDVYNDIVNLSLDTNVGRYSTQEAGYQAALKQIEKARALGMPGEILVENQQTTNNGYVFTIRWDYENVDTADVKSLFDEKIAEQNKLIQDYEKQMEAKWREVNPIVNAWLQTDFEYNDLNSKMQLIAETMVSGLDFSNLGLTTQKEVQRYITDNIINPLFLAGDDVEEAFSSIIDWQSALGNGEITLDEFSSNVKSAFDSLLSSVNPDKASLFKDIFVSGFDKFGNTYDEIVAGIISNWAMVSESNDKNKKSLSDLSTALQTLKSNYDIVATAEKEMADDGLSPDTIKSLADATDDYLDYLYEENGIIKLNTEAWKEQSNLEMENSIKAIEEEIKALEDEKTALENAKVYEDEYTGSVEEGAYRQSDYTAAVEKNSDAIAENQTKLGLYEALYNNATGSLDAYTSALQNFTTVNDFISQMSDSLTTVADLQEEVANGFTMSLEKALEFAAVYPEIINGATVAADGQITLNENVVNAFIEGKEAELKAEVDARVAELEAEKARLTAKMNFSQAELELAKSVGDGEGQISKELAEYRVNAGNAVTQALIAAGIDEATAYQLATAAMAQNSVEFDEIAKQVCTDVQGNFNQAAYDAAQSIYTNMQNSEISIASVAEQAHQAAIAIAGIGSGTVQGSSSVNGSGASGSYSSKGNISVTTGSFKGATYSYEAKTISLDSFISDLELDISSYSKAISQIDGQIATLKTLKDISLEKFSTSYKNATSGNGSGSSQKEETWFDKQYKEHKHLLEMEQESEEEYLSWLDSAYKRAYDEGILSIDELYRYQEEVYKGYKSLRESGDIVSEYVADVDKYYDATKKLESATKSRGKLEADIEYTDDLEEKIKITKELISVYEEEYEATEELESLRRKTIESSIDGLKELGFQIQYNASTNELYIENLEHINDIQADSVGEYGSLQEATNALREGTEDLIDTLEELNKSNQESSDSAMELKNSIKEAKSTIIDYLNDIVSEANDVVDGFQDVYTTLTDAAKEYTENGYLSVDILQKILELSPKYLAMLADENGQLVINEDRLKAVISAKTEELGAETALSYAKQILLATEQNEIQTLISLTEANSAAAGATWDMAYATIGLARAIGVANGIDSSYYDNAVSYISKMQSLTYTAVNSVSAYYDALSTGAESVTEKYEKQQDGLETILRLTEDMIKQENEGRIDALEAQKDAYADIIEQKKELINLTKEQEDHESSITDKLKKAAKLQAQISALSLDDSRSAQAERRALEEELAELQNDIYDEQNDYYVDAQNDALDKELDAFNDTKDEEIEDLKNMLSSTEKLYQAAISRIDNNWDSLYQDLLAWNYEYGNTLQSDLISAWDSASEAVQRYGSYVAAVNGVEASINASGVSGGYTIGGYSDYGSGTYGSAANIITSMRNNSISWHSATSAERESLSAQNLALAEQYRQISGENIYRKDGVWYHADGTVLYTIDNNEIARSIVAKMKSNSALWSSSSESVRNALSSENERLGKNIASLLGSSVTRDSNGVWWIDGKKLYDVYHNGGIVGNTPTLKQNEVMSILEKGEAVLDEEKEKGLYKIVDFISILSDRLGKTLDESRVNRIFNMSPAIDIPTALVDSVKNSRSDLIGSIGSGNYTIEKIDVTAPISVVQKLDKDDIIEHSKMIGSISADYIKEGFTKRGINTKTSIF